MGAKLCAAEYTASGHPITSGRLWLVPLSPQNAGYIIQGMPLPALCVGNLRRPKYHLIETRRRSIQTLDYAWAPFRSSGIFWQLAAGPYATAKRTEIEHTRWQDLRVLKFQNGPRALRRRFRTLLRRPLDPLGVPGKLKTLFYWWVP